MTVACLMQSSQVLSLSLLNPYKWEHLHVQPPVSLWGMKLHLKILTLLFKTWCPLPMTLTLVTLAPLTSDFLLWYCHWSCDLDLWHWPSDLTLASGDLDIDLQVPCQKSRSTGIHVTVPTDKQTGRTDNITSSANVGGKKLEMQRVHPVINAYIFNHVSPNWNTIMFKPLDIISISAFIRKWLSSLFVPWGIIVIF